MSRRQTECQSMNRKDMKRFRLFVVEQDVQRQKLQCSFETQYNEILHVRSFTAKSRLFLLPCQHNLAFFSGCHFNWYKRCASGASKDTWQCCKVLVSEAHPKKPFKTETSHLTLTSQHIKLLQKCHASSNNMSRLSMTFTTFANMSHKKLANDEFFDDFVWFCCTFNSTKHPFLNLEPLEAKRRHSPPPRSLCAKPQLMSGSWAVCGLSAVILLTYRWHYYIIMTYISDEYKYMYIYAY